MERIKLRKMQSIIANTFKGFPDLYLFIVILLLYSGCATPEKPASENSTKKEIYWGDLHLHNAVGYGKGSLARTYKIAESHLDFLCFTPHTQWFDMPIMPQNAHLKWERGFKVSQDAWDSVKLLVNEYYRPGKFVPFLGYEWHSSLYGDLCIIFPDEKGDLLYFDDIQSIQKYAREMKAVLIPHHPAYKGGWRGQDWEVLEEDVSPVAEIYSEHGNAESDRAPLPYIRHSMGGVYTPNTLHALWEKGMKAGVVASTDNHSGFAGAYGEGLTAVYADELTRESVMEAIKAKRTYGVSADRIELDFRLNGHYMGESISQARRRNMSVKVKGKAAVDRVEILKNNQVICRDFPVDRVPGESRWGKPVYCRIEYGWGPWGDLDMAKICDWQLDIEVKNGKILSVSPCYQSGPFDENRYHDLSGSGNKYKLISYTSRIQAFAENATNSIILEIQGSPETELFINLEKPKQFVIHKTFEELEESNDIFFTGPFTSESLMVHRLVFHDNYFTEFEFVDKATSGNTDWYYARVIQTNGSLAWSSPIWVGE